MDPTWCVCLGMGIFYFWGSATLLSFPVTKWLSLQCQGFLSHRVQFIQQHGAQKNPTNLQSKSTNNNNSKEKKTSKHRKSNSVPCTKRMFSIQVQSWKILKATELQVMWIECSASRAQAWFVIYQQLASTLQIRSAAALEGSGSTGESGKQQTGRAVLELASVVHIWLRSTKVSALYGCSRGYCCA